jgi:phosphoribosylanthranilate isomerase
MFVKICGITRPSDAEAARMAGANAIGINFWPGSKRFIGSIERAKEVAQAAGDLTTVGVFVNASADEITRALEVVQLVQLHGDETPAFAEPFRGRYVRAVRVKNRESLGELAAFSCPWYLLDGFSAGYGGQGAKCDWTLAAEAAQAHKVVLAGGLDPDNVLEAVRAVRPFGVDTASGVESAPGIKDPDRILRFIEEAQRS